MAELLGKLGGVEKTVEEIFSHVRADKNRGEVNSATDKKITDLITDLSRPLNEVPASNEGEYVGENIGIIEPYMMASHLRLSLALLQKRRAEANITRYKTEIANAKKPGAKKKAVSKSTLVRPVTYEQLINDQRDVIIAHANIYAKQVLAANAFNRTVVHNDQKAKMAFYAKGVTKCGKTPYLKGTSQFTDKNKYASQSRFGGDKKFGPARHALRRTFYDKFRPNSSPSIRNPGIMLFDRTHRIATDCNKTRTMMLGSYLNSAMFFQQNIRYSVKHVYVMLDKQMATAKKLAGKYKFNLGVKAKRYPDLKIMTVAKTFDNKFASWQ